MLARIVREYDGLVVQVVVRFPIVIFVMQSVTDPESVIRCHRCIPEIEQAVEISAEVETVLDAVLAAVCIGLDVCRFEDGSGVLTRDRTCLRVSIPDSETEQSLTESRSHSNRLSEAFVRRCRHDCRFIDIPVFA
jgi:hypothetical protein